jgi:DNA-binding transcriptional ArsR family regulator
MDDRLILTRLDQVRALADPLRLKLVEALIADERPVAALARVVGTPVTRLYHHIDLLLEADLIQVTRRVRRRGAEERFYRATAREYQLAGNLLELAPDRDRSVEGLIELGRSVLGGALEELTTGLREGAIVPGRQGRGFILQNRHTKLSAKAFNQLAKELPEWLDRFVERHGSTRGTDCRIAIAAFPAPPSDRP